MNFLDFNPDLFVRQSFWSLFFGSVVYYLMQYSIDQQMIQRFMAAKSQKTAQRALLLNIPLSFFIMSLCCLVGLVLHANFFYCDPLSYKETGIKSPNQLVGRFVVTNLKLIPGMSGLFLGALLCGSLSSLSSVLNSQVSIIWNDYCRSISYFKKFDDNQSLKTNKILVFIFGFIDTGFAFIISTFGGNLIQINSSLNGAFIAPIIGLFILAAFFKHTNSKGAICGTIAGFATGVWISIGAYFKKPHYPKLKSSTLFCGYENLTSLYIYENYFKEKFMIENNVNSSYFGKSFRAQNLGGIEIIYSLSYKWYCAFGIIITLLVGSIVSCATKSSKEVNDDFIIFDLEKYFSKKLITMKSTTNQKKDLSDFSSNKS